LGLPNSLTKRSRKTLIISMMIGVRKEKKQTLKTKRNSVICICETKCVKKGLKQ